MAFKYLTKPIIAILVVVESVIFVHASIIIPIKKNHLVGAVSYTISNKENPKGWEQFPIINIDGSSSVNVSFDLLESNQRQLSYKIRKMEYDWSESRMPSIQYINAFNSVDIENFKPSISTLVDYCNYQFDLNAKNENLGITKSGNFILSVFDKYEPDNILFEFPFAVLDNNTNVKVEKSLCNNQDVMKTQSLDIEVGLNDLLYDIRNNIKVVVLQNGLWENALILNSPSNIQADKIEYKNQSSAVFYGSGQFYKIEHIGDRTYGMGIDHIYMDNDIYNVVLLPNRNKSDMPYEYEKDQYGRQVIRTLSSLSDPNVYADYQLVKFKFVSEKIKNSNVVLSGECFRFMPDDYVKMKYNDIDGCYELSVLLKMGYQEYKYLTKDNNNLSSDKTMGDHYQTMNQYTILVYYNNIKYNSYDLIGYNVYKTN